MALPGPLVRVLALAGLLALVVLAAVGGLALRAPGVVAVGVAGLLAALTAAAIARDAPGHSVRHTMETAALAAAGTVGGLLAVSGAAVLVGGAGTVLLLAALAAAWLARGWHRARRARAAGGPVVAGEGMAGVVQLAVVTEPSDGEPAGGRLEPGAGQATLTPPVAGLSTAALGQEWLLTSAALTGRLAPAARRAIVERREEALDELERRDPAGFARWMAAGPQPGSDPAEYVRGGPAADSEAA